MKTKKITLLVLAAVTVAMLMSTVSFADASNRGGNMCFASGRRQHPCFAETDIRPVKTAYLSLSQEQISQINQLRLEFHKASLELKKERDLKRLEIRELNREGSVDLEKIKVKWEEMAQIQTELRVKALDNQLKIKELLTPEQLEKFNLNCPGQRYGMSRGNFDDFNWGTGFGRNRQ